MNAPADTRSPDALAQGFRLGEIRIDPLACIAEGSGGREKLDPKVMDVLVLLARHAGQVVLREQLFEQVWPGVVVSEDALSRCIHELRRQLGLAGGGDQYRELIETVPKRGYRLNSAVEPIPETPEAAPARYAKWWAGGAVIAACAAIALLAVFGQRDTKTQVGSAVPAEAAAANSIAVLPFVDMSAGHDQAWLSDGISEEILNRLSKPGGLRVIARTSSFSFRDRPVDVTEIGTRLGVSYVLEGSLRRSGDEIRITAQLISVSSNAHVWSETYTRTLDDLFAVQDDIAVAVADALQVRLAAGAPGTVTAVNPKAHESYLKGQYFFRRRAPGDVELARRYYEEAVAIDPGYARAWAALAGVYSFLAWPTEKPDLALLKLEGETARKAVALDPTLALAHIRLAGYYYETLDFKKADEHFLQAAALDPDDPLVLGITGYEAFARGDTETAINSLRRAVARDPLSTVSHQNLAVLLMADHQLDEAAAEYRQLLELNPEAGWDIEIEITRIYILQGRFDEARKEIARMPQGKYRDHALALLFKAPGGRADADAALARLTANPVEIMDVVRLAEIHAFRGVNDRAFATLLERKEAMTRELGAAAPPIRTLTMEARVSPLLIPLHTDPRWEMLVSDYP